MSNPSVSAEALKRLSMEIGASFESVDGSVFNAAGNKGIHISDKPKADYQKQLLEKLVERVTKEVHAPVIQEPKTVVVHAPKPTAVSWSFKFKRNPDGTLDEIIATPKKE